MKLCGTKCRRVYLRLISKVSETVWPESGFPQPARRREGRRRSLPPPFSEVEGSWPRRLAGPGGALRPPAAPGSGASATGPRAGLGCVPAL